MKENKENQEPSVNDVEKEPEVPEIEVNDSVNEDVSESDKTAELEKKVEELSAKYLLLSADFDNYRKRILKEKSELIKSAGESVLKELLPVIDDFERALKSMESANDVPALKDGVDLIYARFVSFLAQEGVKAIDCVGKDFTTDEQEAVARIPSPMPEQKGKVLDCTKKGYTLNGKIIRFAQVVVAD